MVRSVRVASCVSVVGLILALPATARADPPVCDNAKLDTPPNTPLTLSGLTCRNVAGTVTPHLVSGPTPPP
jgi:hypothetical protein